MYTVQEGFNGAEPSPVAGISCDGIRPRDAGTNPDAQGCRHAHIPSALPLRDADAAPRLVVIPCRNRPFQIHAPDLQELSWTRHNFRLEMAESRPKPGARPAGTDPGRTLLPCCLRRSGQDPAPGLLAQSKPGHNTRSTCRGTHPKALRQVC